MGFAKAYLDKYCTINKRITRAPAGLLKYIIIIPAYCEPDILVALKALANQTKIPGKTEVIIVFNYSESDPKDLKEQNHIQYRQATEWSENNNNENMVFHVILMEDVPDKDAGAGFARKTAMDLAVSRFEAINRKHGIILSLDADTIVPENYLGKIDLYLSQHPECKTLLFNFSHNTNGKDYLPNVYQAITLYELHLRFYRKMLENIHFPFPYFTIGSCFGIRADIYCKAGGMSKRKAGEDFYFLNKVFPFGGTHFFRDIILAPSSRPSWRVPFGTGPAIRKLITMPSPTLLTYNPEAFLPVKKLLKLVPQLFEATDSQANNILDTLEGCLPRFLIQNKFYIKWQEIKNNANNPDSFIKRFYSWFNAFMLIKYLNYAKYEGYPDIEITEATASAYKMPTGIPAKELLRKIRELDSNENFEYLIFP
jgi:hypothetical protein